MMTPEESKTVTDVFGKFMENEKHAVEWDNLDDQMMYLEYLEDHQIVREAEALYQGHSEGTVRCSDQFCNDECYAATIVEAAKIIIDLYNDTKNLHIKNRYVLENYVALSSLQQIVTVLK